ncbi:MAG TPA: hypothetical protein VGK56_05965, partial [Anaerolineales bacterium]
GTSFGCCEYTMRKRTLNAFAARRRRLGQMMVPADAIDEAKGFRNRLCPITTAAVNKNYFVSALLA